MKDQIEHVTVISIAKKPAHAQAASLARTALQSMPNGIRTLPRMFKRQVGTVTLAWSKLG
ncbi:MAG TPA: hypothetical protein VN039_01645 [Nitrospira sp.]|nr:hypothetical protein [Nitrospira sp.]